MRAPSLATDILCLTTASKQLDVTSRPSALETDNALECSRSCCATLSSLVDLPPELLTAICAHLECETIATCRAVCRRFKDVVDASLELQYRIELVRDGMVDGGGGSLSQAQAHETGSVAPLSIADRLARLRQLRNAWHMLRWTRCVTVPMPGPCCAYELVGGMFCKTQPRARRDLGHHVPLPGLPAAVGAGFGAGAGAGADVGAGAGFLGWDDWLGDMPGDWDEGFGFGEGEGEAAHAGATTYEYGSRTMSATWLPGAGTDDRGRTVVRDDLGITTRDFAIDPSQDLMVLFKGGEEAGLLAMAVFPGALELHVRTISTNQTHPEARVPVLCTPVLYPVTSVFIQIVDDVVGMMYCIDPARPRITIWNWKTGNLVVDRGSGNLPPGTWDFSFINSRALLVTTGNESGSLELFTFTCDRADDVDADSDPSTPTQPRPHPTSTPPTSPLVHVASLHLPPVHPAVRVLNVGTHTGPYLAACPPGKPFGASNAERIHVLTIQYIHLPMLDGPRTRPKMCVFLHNRVLERYLGVASSSSGMATPPIVIPWRQWGRTHARMLLHVGTFQWLRYVHGQRVVMLLPTSEPGRSTLQVLDFNVRRAAVDSDTHRIDMDERPWWNQNVDNDDSDDVDYKTTLEHVDYPTRIVMPNIFVDAIESGLPYCEARRDVRGEYSGMMIDDERLVGLKYPAFLTGDMKEIDVLTM